MAACTLSNNVEMNSAFIPKPTFGPFIFIISTSKILSRGLWKTMFPGKLKLLNYYSTDVNEFPNNEELALGKNFNEKIA